MSEIRKRWGDNDTASIKVAKRRLQWLGHLAHMSDFRLPRVSVSHDHDQDQGRGGDIWYEKI